MTNKTTAGLVLLAAVVVAGELLISRSQGSAGAILYGDANCDDSVTSVDAAVILQTDAGLISVLDCPDNADSNADDVINSIDSALVLQFVAGLTNTLGPASATATATQTRTPPPAPTATPTPVSSCHPSYVGVCLDPEASDYDCLGGGGNGPLYVEGPFQVVGPDKFGLDADDDGVGCE